MDNLTRRLREDASQIRADISPQLDARIRASLEAVEPVKAETPKPPPRTASMWWWSSLVGATGALVVIVLLNLSSQPQAPVPVAPEIPAVGPSLNIQRAVLTEPLEQELEDLESDLKRVEEALMAEIGISSRAEEDEPDSP